MKVFNRECNDIAPIPNGARSCEQSLPNARSQRRTNSYQVTGRENDGTGLYYYRARYYSPTFQGFIAQDPMGLGGGANLYTYAANDPIGLSDPSGQDPFTGLVLGGILGVENGWIYSGGSLEGALFGGVSGAAAGFLVGWADPTDILSSVAAGAAGAAIGNVTGQGLALGTGGQCDFHWGSFLGSILGGAAVGAITGTIPLGAQGALLARGLTVTTLDPLGPGLGTGIGGLFSSQ